MPRTRQTDDGPVTLRRRILRAAFEEFMQRGYAGTSTLDIASRAKVSKRDLYAEFGSKHAMLEACIAERAERMRLPLQLPAPRDRDGLLATLMTFGASLLSEAARPEVIAVYRLAIGEAERSPDIARTLDTLGRAQTRQALSRLFVHSQSLGLIGSGNAGDMAEDFIALLWRGNLLMRLQLGTVAVPGAKECERRAENAAHSLLKLYPIPTA
ncbi:MAG TPA: TetR/AcrR family transcriptional regulator [Acetobacteraceae bacterium]|nr:TetR/AcrR family transcriptional regulator [Acetobacteraceae bacterium]